MVTRRRGWDHGWKIRSKDFETDDYRFGTREIKGVSQEGIVM